MYGTRCCFIHSVDKSVIGRAISQNIDIVPVQKNGRLKSLTRFLDENGDAQCSTTEES